MILSIPISIAVIYVAVSLSQDLTSVWSEVSVIQFPGHVPHLTIQFRDIDTESALEVDQDRRSDEGSEVSFTICSYCENKITIHHIISSTAHVGGKTIRNLLIPTYWAAQTNQHESTDKEGTRKTKQPR